MPFTSPSFWSGLSCTEPGGHCAGFVCERGYLCNAPAAPPERLHNNSFLAIFEYCYISNFYVVWWGLRAAVLGRMGALTFPIQGRVLYPSHRPPFAGRGC